MIQCKDCEFFHRSPDGRIGMTCEPFSSIKEPECLQKWQLLKADQLVQSYQAMLSFYQRLSPLQEQMLKIVKREMDDMNDSESWKEGSDDEPDMESL